jgi:hypothetical protein
MDDTIANFMLVLKIGITNGKVFTGSLVKLAYSENIYCKDSPKSRSESYRSICRGNCCRMIVALWNPSPG